MKYTRKAKIISAKLLTCREYNDLRDGLTLIVDNVDKEFQKLVNAVATPGRDDDREHRHRATRCPVQ